ncbi:MAG: acyltransferase [Gemmatimonadaceae bacterium]
MAPVSHQITPAGSGRLERLNALRGPAALLVVLYHVRQIAVRDMGSAGGFEFWRFGHAGVDLFFVISGFVIYLVHRRDIEKPQAIRRFLVRRFIRVYPPLWIVTTAVLIGALLTAHAVRAEKMDAWFILRSYLLWPIQGALPLVPPAWTLSHEIKFYLLFAIAIALPGRLWKPLVSAVFAGSVLTGLVEAIAPTALPFAITFLLSPYNLEFAAGVTVAMLVLGRVITAPRALAAIGVVAWAVAAAHDQSLQAPDVAQALRYGIPSAIVVLGVAARDAQHPAFRAPLLRLLGDASYSIYLVHLPTIVVAVRFAKFAHARPTSVALTAVAFLATAVGIAFHLLVERPITRVLAARVAAKPSGAVAA